MATLTPLPQAPAARSATTSTTSPTVAASGAVTGTPRRWLRIEGLAAFIAGAAVYTGAGMPLLAFVPLLLAVDVSMAGYLAGPRAGAAGYNLAHNWAAGLLVLGLGMATAAAPVLGAGAILVAHTGMDRLAGYGLKYPTEFADTHLGRLGGRAR